MRVRERDASGLFIRASDPVPCMRLTQRDKGPVTVILRRIETKKKRKTAQTGNFK